MKKLREGFNRNQIKYLAILVMVMDHCHHFFQDGGLLYYLCRIPSRITGPVMAYFIVEGYLHTRNVKKYAWRLFLFSLISWPFYVYFEYGSFEFVSFVEGMVYSQPAIYIKSSGMSLVLNLFGVFSTLLCCLLAVMVLDRKKWNTVTKTALIAGILWISLFTDWRWFLVAYSICFFVFRDDHRKMWLGYSVVTLLYCFWVVPDNPFLMRMEPAFAPYRLAGFLVIPLMEYGYNGKPGKKTPFNQYFFYLFYPTHHLLLGILRQIFGV